MDLAEREARRLEASLGPVVDITGVPAGLDARSIQQVRPDSDGGWRVIPDRRRRLRLTQVALVPDDVPDAPAASRALEGLLSDAARAFVLGARTRRWPTVVDRFQDWAWPTAVALARTGIVVMRCQVTDRRLGEPVGWTLTLSGSALARERARQTATSNRERDERRQQAVADLATLLDADEPASLPAPRAAIAALHAALRDGSGQARLPVLAAAAADLAAGIRSNGPRAFSLRHFAHSKERDDVAKILADAGVPDEVAAALGVRRAARIGIAGHIDIHRGRIVVALSALDGPVLLRADQPDIRMVAHARRLVIVENLQAAETLADFARTVADPLAIAYTGGVPGPGVRGHLGELIDQVDSTLLCPDADLGGVRIAAAILDDLPAATAARVTLCDVGRWPHKRQPAWPADGATVASLREAVTGPAASLAAACLDRGYRVEQEEVIAAATFAWLKEL
jgi:hypothetical protein